EVRTAHPMERALLAAAPPPHCAGPRPVVAVRPRRRDLPCLPQASERERAGAGAPDAIDHGRGAIGRRAARRDDHAGKTTIVLIGSGGGRRAHDGAVGKAREAADLVAGHALRERRIAELRGSASAASHSRTAKLSPPFLMIERLPPAVRTATRSEL